MLSHCPIDISQLCLYLNISCQWLYFSPSELEVLEVSYLDQSMSDVVLCVLSTTSFK